MKALDFNLQSTNGKSYSLKESIGKYVVLYFYPKDDTPGCTIETKDFNNSNTHETLSKSNIMKVDN